MFCAGSRTFKKSFCCSFTLLLLSGWERQEAKECPLMCCSGQIHNKHKPCSVAFPLQSGLEFLKLAEETVGSSMRLHCAIVQNDLTISPDLSVVMAWVISNICLPHQYLTTLLSIASFLLPLIFPSTTVWFYFIYYWMTTSQFKTIFLLCSAFLIIHTFHKCILKLGRS